MKKLFLNFYGVTVSVSADHDKIICLLKKDFSFFADNLRDQADLEVKLFSHENKNPPFPLLLKRFASEKVLVYQKRSLRICDYHGDAMSIVDFKKKTCEVYSPSKSRLHEIAYLYILSRVGKELDLKGMHRLHGMAVISGVNLLVGMMSMGGGKTTLLSYLLATEKVSLLSDDSPLIDSEGDVHPFPIRIGFEKEAVRPEYFRTIPMYQLQRKEYGLKELYSIADIKAPIGKDYKKIKLFLGKRSNNGFTISSLHKLRAWLFAFEQGVIGVGLPILVEYFWEFGCTDFFTKTKIFFMRLKAMTKFVNKSEVYEVSLSEDLEQNARSLLKKWA